MILSFSRPRMSDFQLRREVFRRPARQLPEHIALVQRDRGHLIHPGPARMGGDDRQICGKSAASSSMAEGWAWRIFAPMPPGIPAPIPVVPTSIITGTFNSSIASNSG